MRLLIAILVVSILGIGIGLALLGSGLFVLGYPLLYLFVFVPLDDIFFTHWYTYVNDFYDTRAAKRIVPVLVTAVGIGGIVGGLTMPLLNKIATPGQIIYIWMGTLVVAAVLAWIQPRVFGKRRLLKEQPQYASTSDTVKSRQSQLANIREGFRYVFRSSFLRSLALSALLLILLLTFLEYRTGVPKSSQGGWRHTVRRIAG